MAQIERHAPGAFCWIELATTDQKAAKQFYDEIFGWTAKDTPIGPDEVYTIFQIDDRDAAAGYTLRPEHRQMGIPPHWMLYVSVASADNAAERAADLGGTVIDKPFDVAEHGRMAVVRDPTGAVFSMWEARKHIGVKITGVDGTLCWADLNTPDPARAVKFYSGLFGWEMIPGDGEYLHIKNGNDYIGGIPPLREQSATTPAHWLPYFLVSSADETTMNADARGAKVYMQPITMEKVGRIAILADPQGAVFALYEAARKAA
jgi:predicted enzyme related to lactoylglutathione lyase